MFCIHFSNRTEAILFYNAIVSEQKLWIFKEHKDGFDVKLMNASLSGAAYVEAIRAFLQVIRKRKMLGWMEGVLKHRYYYEDAQEVQRMLEIGQDFEDKPPAGLQLPPIYHYLRAFIQDYLIARSYVEFDELSAACLQSVHESLIEYTGKIIDEYKQEESYQLLVDSWRHRVHHKDTGVQLLHLLDDGRLTYYHDEGNPISESETRLYMKQYPDDCIAHLPIEWPVTPALAHAPDELIIYSDETDHSNLELLMNIFEEKASWRPKSQFPFKMG
ncbi:sporulation protein YtxC [Halobacillus sp. SY10]|uniref:Putative sporulation protein YtxC n=1 Tax=Halobacillus aidingensis TaxID=240303 RepID=A0A1H0E6L5_HALAD|nr:sporulation protein YtxC [Halobacillus aidingensis]SDN77953.1 putative sporulation protein YtxC [Halobacillus aidingensis]